jgi:hypothetical protein
VAGSFSYSPSAGTVLSVGPHTLTATFNPTDTTDYTTSTATVILTVIPATPALTVTSNANPVFLSNPVTFTASISAYGTLPTGTIAFYDGTTQIGSSAVAAGVATFTTSALAAGPHSITAVYSGDSSYGPAKGGPLSELAEDFTIAPAGGGAVTVSAGGLASFPLVVTPVGGPTMPSAINLSVTGLSLASTGSFSPASVAAGSGTTTVMLQVQLLILLPFAGRLRKAARQWRRLAVLALLGAALAVGFTGCGGPGKINSELYSLTVTATSGSLSHSTTLSLTVQ